MTTLLGGKGMEYIVFGIILLISIVLLWYGVKRKKIEIFLNFVLRMAAGTLGIYLVNTILTSFNSSIMVGLNSYNVLTLGVLGTPGFLLLYGVSTYFALKA